MKGKASGPMTDWIGKQLGKYKIIELLGQGGMAEVYKAYHPTLERHVAIKLIHAHLLNTAEATDRFRREAKVVAALRHHNIVQVHDFDVAENNFYMVMEYVPGVTLYDHLQKHHRYGRRLPLPEALTLFQTITAAVAHAHAQNIIHRDIKPANVLLTPEREPILTDFGLSKLVSDESLDASLVLGTPHYMSPEQACGDTVDERTDIYALGVMLYELSTGSLPFSGDTPAGIIFKQINDPFTLPRALAPDLPEPLERLIVTMLAKNPDERPTAAALLRTTESLLASLTTAADSTLTLLSAAADDGRCPYRGLQSFETEHAEFYFGRERLVEQVVERLTGLTRLRPAPLSTLEMLQQGRGRLLTLLGASGSGKSSLLRAGVLPALDGAASSSTAPPTEASWQTLIIKPGSHPLETLAAHLIPVLEAEGDHLAATRQLLDNMTADSRALHLRLRLAWREAPPDQHLLLIVDQFEEIFTLCHDEEARERFIENLLYAASAREGRLILLLAMRADFYHHCADYRHLARQMASQQLLVGAMNEVELRRAIEEPARVVGLRFEPGLVETILADVSEQPGSLPLLQHALLELWERREQGALTLRAYHDLGGVAGAVAQRADSIYADFDPDEQTIVRRIMLRLTQPGQGTADTRRRVPKQELLSGDQTGQIEAVIRQLVEARLVTTTLETATHTETVEVVHEALIRGWQRLRGWLDEDRAALHTHRRLTEAALAWQRGAQDDGYLYRGARLAEAEIWAEQYGAEMNDLERDFLAASIAHRTRIAAERAAQQQRELAAAQALAEERSQAAAKLRRRAQWLIAAVLIVAALAVAALFQTRRATQARETAEAQRAVAEAQNLAAQAQANLTDWPRRSLLLAQAAVQATEPPLPVALQTLRHILASTGGLPRPGSDRPTETTIRAVSFNAEGTLLATAAEVAAPSGADTACSVSRRRGLVRLWSPGESTGPPLEMTHDCPVLTLAFGPATTAEWLATGQSDGTVQLHHLAEPSAAPLTLTGAGDGVTVIAFSPDGQWLAAGSLSRVRLWSMPEILNDPDSAEPLRLDMPALGFVGSRDNQFLAFSPDSQWLAVTHRLWALTDPGRHPDITLPGYDGPGFATGVAFSPDSQQLATTQQEAILVWPVEDLAAQAEPVTRLPGHEGAVRALTFSPDGRWLASVGADRRGQLYDVTDLSAAPLPLTSHEENIWRVAFSPDSRWLVTAGDDRTVRLWATADPSAPPTLLRGHEGRISDVAFSPDSRWLTTAGSDGTARLWSLHNPLAEPVIETTARHETRLTATHPTDGWLAASDDTGHIWLWSPQALTGTAAPVRLAQPAPVTTLAFLPEWLISGDVEGTLRLWSLAEPGRDPIVITTEGGPLRTMATASPWLATEHNDLQTRLWAIEDLASSQAPAPLIVIGDSAAPARPVALSPDGRWLVTSGYEARTNGWDGHIRLWQLDAGSGPATEIMATTYGVEVSTAAFSRDSRWLVVGTWGQTGQLWDLADPDATPQAINLLSESGDHIITTVASDRAGRWLVTGGFEGAVRLWNLGEAESHPATLTALTLPGHTDSVSAMAFDRTGRRLATGSRDGATQLWDLTAADIAASATVLPGITAVRAILFEAEENLLITAHGDNIIQRWHMRPETLVELACTIAGRSLSDQEWQQFFGEQPYQPGCSP